jgi:hypothetical protein
LIAFELPRVQVEHALALVLLVRDVQRERYASFAARFVAKLRDDAEFAESETALAAAALSTLGGPAAEVGAHALIGVLEALEQRRAAADHRSLASAMVNAGTRAIVSHPTTPSAS